MSERVERTGDDDGDGAGIAEPAAEVEAVDAARAAALSAVLGDEATTPVDELSAATLAGLERRADARRQRKLVGLVAAAVVVVLVVSAALAAGRGSSPSTTDLAAGGTSSVAAGPVTTALPSATTPGSSAGPDTEPESTTTTCLPAGASGLGDPCDSTTTTSGATPSSSLPAPPTSPAVTGPGGPVTTVPPSSDPSTPPTASTLVPPDGDCGSWGPVGWPTTFVVPRSYIDCILAAFETGQFAHLQVTEYTAPGGGGDPAYPLVTTYTITGVHQVRVVVDATKAADRPQKVTTSECTSLTSAWPNSSVVTPGNCTVISVQ